MVRRWVCGVVAAAMILGSLGWSELAMAEQPADYYGSEFWFAEFGAFFGGFVGYFAASESGFCSGGIHSNSFFFSWDICPMLFWDTGRALGAGLGVTFTGLNYGVEGNVLMAHLLPLVSLTGTALLKYTVPRLDPLAPLFALIHLPGVPALLATIGYNIGAKMKDTGQPASLPWRLDLPMLSLEF